MPIGRMFEQYWDVAQPAEWCKGIVTSFTHRVAFIVCALVLLALIATGARVNPLDAPIIAGLLILFLGVPHGAFDVAIWKARRNSPTSGNVAAMLVRYVAFAISFFIIWLLAPALALPVFLIISIYHFSGDWVHDLEQIPRWIVAAAMLTAPAGLHRDEVVQIFSWLSPVETAETVGLVMAAVAIPLLQASTVAVALICMHRPWAAIEIVVVLGLAWVTPPMLFFLVYFCGLHSVRHMIETQRLIGARSVRRFLLAACPYAPLAIGGTLVGALSLSTLPPGPAILGAIFMALGALTVPHIIVIDGEDAP
ncbi:MAG: Brp/Blh family beta-carotene 15,15'-dioxygenase [Pseudomonadota bacterium]